MDMMLNSCGGSLNIPVFNHSGLLLYGSSRRTLRDAFAGKGMQINLFVSIETAEYLPCFLPYLTGIVCSQHKTEPVEPCPIPLLFPCADESRQNVHKRIRIIDRYDINQEPVSDVDFQVQHTAVTRDIGLATDAGKHFFRTVTTESSSYKGYNVLCFDHRHHYIRIVISDHQEGKKDSIAELLLRH
jgi:hypothetical protein